MLFTWELDRMSGFLRSSATWNMIFCQNCVQMNKLLALMLALNTNTTQSIKINSLLKVPTLFRKKDKQRNFIIFYVIQYHLAMESWEFSKHLSQTKQTNLCLPVHNNRKNVQNKHIFTHVFENMWTRKTCMPILMCVGCLPLTCAVPLDNNK